MSDEDGEVALPLDHHPLLSQSDIKRSTTTYQDDSSDCDPLECAWWCLTILWSGLKLIGDALWCCEDQSNETDINADKIMDCENNPKGGGGTKKLSTARKVFCYCLLWEIPQPSTEIFDWENDRRNGMSLVKPLENPRNRCYFNVIIQVINQTKEIHDMLKLPHHYTLQSTTGKEISVTVSERGPVSAELYNLLTQINNPGHRLINTGLLLSKMNERDNMGRFSGRNQQDSHELLRYLLTQLKEEEIQIIKSKIKDYFPPLNSDMESEYLRMVNKLTITLEQKFGGIFINTVICRECYKAEQLQESFIDISQSIPDQETADESSDHETRRYSVTELHGTPRISNTVSPVSINDDDEISPENPVRQEVVTSPKLSLSPNTNKEMIFQQTAVDLKVAMATEYAPLQEHLCKEGLEYHPVTEASTNTELIKTDLERSLNNYTDVDVLDDDNRFICNHCHRKDSLVSKQALIMKLNNVLILHIKRFNLGGPTVTKNDNFLSFNQLLDMAPYCTNTCLNELKDDDNKVLYGLYAVVIHIGTTLKSGHYIAYVRTRPIRSTDSSAKHWKYNDKAAYDGQWYSTNDDSITKCSNGFEDVKSQKAYILFYELLPRVRTYQSTAV